MFLLDRNSLGGYNPNGPNNVLGTFDIGNCWCGRSYFLGSDGVGRVVSSGSNQAIVWKVQTSPSVSLIKESTSAPLNSGQDGGFLTSVSSNGQDGASTIVRAVARPTTPDPAYVTSDLLMSPTGTISKIEDSEVTLTTLPAARCGSMPHRLDSRARASRLLSGLPSPCAEQKTHPA